MRFSLLSVLLSAAVAVPTAAYADTVIVDSTPGVTTYTSNGTSGVAVAYTNVAYGAPVGSSQFISTSATGGDGSVGEVDYTATFTLLADESYTGTLSFLADDYGGVLVNGASVYALNTSGPGQFMSPTDVMLDPSDFVAGTNTITLQDFNTGGPAAADFSATLTGASVTPEPSSLVLLGTGLVGLAGAARRRILA